MLIAGKSILFAGENSLCAADHEQFAGVKTPSTLKCR